MKKWSHRKFNIMFGVFIFTTILWIALFFLVASRADIKPRPGMVGLPHIVLGGMILSSFLFITYISSHRPTSRRPLPLYATVRVAPYEAFCGQLFQSTERRGFSPQQTSLLGENAHTTFAYSTGEEGTVLLQTVWMPDFDESLVDAASDATWNGALAELGDCFTAGTVTLLQLVCVQRMNSPFRTFAARKVYQQERRYHIVCPLSFGGKKAYLRPAKGTFLDPHYKQAEALFQGLTADLFDFPEKKKKND